MSVRAIYEATFVVDTDDGQVLVQVYEDSVQVAFRPDESKAWGPPFRAEAVKS